jgi:hypothetical protein
LEPRDVAHGFAIPFPCGICLLRSGQLR